MKTTSNHVTVVWEFESPIFLMEMNKELKELFEKEKENLKLSFNFKMNEILKGTNSQYESIIIFTYGYNAIADVFYYTLRYIIELEGKLIESTKKHDNRIHGNYLKNNPTVLHEQIENFKKDMEETVEIICNYV